MVKSRQVQCLTQWAPHRWGPWVTVLARLVFEGRWAWTGALAEVLMGFWVGLGALLALIWGPVVRGVHDHTGHDHLVGGTGWHHSGQYPTADQPGYANVAQHHRTGHAPGATLVNAVGLTHRVFKMGGLHKVGLKGNQETSNGFQRPQAVNANVSDVGATC